MSDLRKKRQQLSGRESDPKSRNKGSSYIRGTTMSTKYNQSRKSDGKISGKLPGIGTKQPILVTDEAGVDVTPLSLMSSSQSKGIHSSMGDITTAGTPSDFVSQFGAGTVTSSSFIGGPFTRSVFSQSQEASDDDVDDEPSGDLLGVTWLKREQADEVITKEDLKKNVEILLMETDTETLFEINGLCVATDTEEAKEIKANNSRYLELLKSRPGNDRYVPRGMNTFNDALKSKSSQTVPVFYANVGTMATRWKMHDTFEEENVRQNEDESIEVEDVELDAVDKGSSTVISIKSCGESFLKQYWTDLDKIKIVSVSKTGSSSGSYPVSNQEIEVAKPKVENSFLQSDEFKRSLFVMERTINLNTYQPKFAIYRDLPVLQKDIKESSSGSLDIINLGPSLEKLWEYSCPLTKGMNVSSFSWNRTDPDTFAVGYGQFEFKEQKPGLACCWSLKNPEYPERIYRSDYGVTAVDFSAFNTSLLAVGFHNGGLAVYNVRHIKDKPVLDTFMSQGKHTAPIWWLTWLEKERASGEGMSEVIVSISPDGRVTQWSIRKGFECNDLMRLKRITSPRVGVRGREKKWEAFISHYANGMCFDFHSHNPNFYLVGTEDGFIHKCSCSYSEQYLDTYTGHKSPVYCIQWSPFVGDIFLSCSADWTVQLWHQNITEPILIFFSSIVHDAPREGRRPSKRLQEKTVFRMKPVYYIAWSPRSSTVFASVNEEGIDVWDLGVTILDPIIQFPLKGIPIIAVPTVVTFARNSNCLLVGDNDGVVTVYLLKGMPDPPVNQAEALTSVVETCLANKLDVQSDMSDHTELVKLSDI